jgi:hypothetical protein
MDILTLAMAKPKVIDLDEYGIGQYILYLFSQGGGTHTVEGVSGFWDAVNTNRPIEVRTLAEGETICVNGVTKVVNGNGACTQLSFSIMLDYFNTVYTINVNMKKLDETKAIITVKVA